MNLMGRLFDDPITRPRQSRDPLATHAINVQCAAGEIKRELLFRARLYPRWIRDDKMTEEEADRHVRRLTNALLLVEAHNDLLAIARDVRLAHRELVPACRCAVCVRCDNAILRAEALV